MSIEQGIYAILVSQVLEITLGLYLSMYMYDNNSVLGLLMF